MHWLIAHEGGWDELLLFIGPIVLAFVAVRALERRAKRRRAADVASEASNETPDMSG